MLSAYESLKLSQAAYYDRYRFAQVFVQLKTITGGGEISISAIPVWPKSKRELSPS